MRIKKGFTLAEVLIVLMVIGAIATMTIPSLMKGVTEAQWKTAYKKAYNTLVNLCAMERVAGSLPSTSDDKGVLTMFESLNNSLAVKSYVDKASSALGSGTVIGAADFKTGVKFTNTNGIVISTSTAEDQVAMTAGDTTTPWIVTDDGMGYAVTLGKNGCGTKDDINNAQTINDTLTKACVVVVVDINGINKGPNIFEPQQVSSLTASAPMQTLTGDQYYLFVGRDGATAGSSRFLASGRIVADLK